MSTDLIYVASAVVYAAGWLVMARYVYSRVRPYTEPVGCDRCFVCDGVPGPLTVLLPGAPVPRPPLSGEERGGHCRAECWGQSGTETDGGAVCAALAAATLWPAAVASWLLVMAVYWVVTAGAKGTLEEIAAKTGRLEAETDRLRQASEPPD